MITTNKTHYPLITDWDDAYDNRSHIENALDYPPRWAEWSAKFRAQMLQTQHAELDIVYGDSERQRLDIFLPEQNLKGLYVFVHGGYWKAFDKSIWSWLADKLVQQGYIVAIPSYTLAPAARLSEMTKEIAATITYMAKRFEGPIQLAGHSAGGHLVTRMLCRNAPLAADVQQRINLVHSISGLHDLRPLLNTSMNGVLQLDEAEAIQESSALQTPATHARLVCTVGADERPEFLRQNDLLANIWAGLGVETQSLQVAGRHHFNIIDELHHE